MFVKIILLFPQKNQIIKDKKYHKHEDFKNEINKNKRFNKLKKLLGK